MMRGSDQPLSVTAGQVISAERDQAAFGGEDMDAASLQTLKVDVPCILKSHSRNTQEMTLGPLEQFGGWSEPGPGLAVFPVPAHILP